MAWQYVENIAPSTDRRTRPAGPPRPRRPFATLPAVKGDMPITIDALGVVTPLATVTVKTQIAGKLMEVGFQEGQLVKAGDFLAQINSRPYEAALALAQGQLAKDTALLRAGAIRSGALRNAEQAEFDRAPAGRGSESSSWRRTKPRWRSDQAQIDTANLNIAYCHIVAPVSGRVGLRLVDPGNYLQPSDTTGIVVITQIDPISVVFSTPEDNLPQIAARLNAGATLAGHGVRPRQRQTIGDGNADHLRQPGRRDDRDVQAARDLRQFRRRAVSQSVRQRSPAGRHAFGRGARAQRGHSARRQRQFRLRRQRQFDRLRAQGHDRPGGREEHDDPFRLGGRAKTW